MNQGLLTPKYPVWVMHGGDHFTVGFIIYKGNNLNQTNETQDMPAGSDFDLYH